MTVYLVAECYLIFDHGEFHRDQVLLLDFHLDPMLMMLINAMIRIGVV